jgi:hypothetical protein
MEAGTMKVFTPLFLLPIVLAAAAAGGVSLPESVGAKLHRQPTPDSVARAEQMAGDRADSERISALLAQARKADELGDRMTCEQALKDIGALTR